MGGSSALRTGTRVVRPQLHGARHQGRDAKEARTTIDGSSKQSCDVIEPVVIHGPVVLMLSSAHTDKTRRQNRGLALRGLVAQSVAESWFDRNKGPSDCQQRSSFGDKD